LKILTRLSFLFISISIILNFPTRALGALGQNEDSVDKDIKTLSGTRISLTNDEFTIHQITTSTNIIKEYVSKDGVIFGISWRGRVHPDLSVLLGSYFDEYKNTEANSAKQKGHAPIELKTSNLHIEKSGHMRDLRGRAFDPNLIPKGLTEGVIQ